MSRILKMFDKAALTTESIMEAGRAVAASFRCACMLHHPNACTSSRRSVPITPGRVDIRSQRGLANSVFTVVALPFMLLVIGMILWFGRYFYAKAVVNDAAAAGARWAATSLSGQQGCQQARAAVREVLARHNVNAAGVRLSVAPVASWGRGRTARVTVSYRFANAGAPVIGPLLGDPTVSAGYDVVIDEFNSRWDYGWNACVG
jgi:Flp pilus assembly protein TadG